MTEEIEKVEYVIITEDGLVIERGNTDRAAFTLRNTDNPNCIEIGPSDFKTTIWDRFEKGKFLQREKGKAKVEGLKVTQLPQPCMIAIDGGEPFEVDDGILELDVDYPRTYELRITSLKTELQFVKVIKQ